MNQKPPIRSLFVLLSWSIVVTVSLVICVQFFYNHSFQAARKKSNKSAFNQEEKHLQLVHTFKLHSNLRINRSNEGNGCVKNLYRTYVYAATWKQTAEECFYAGKYICAAHSISDRTIFFRQLRI